MLTQIGHFVSKRHALAAKIRMLVHRDAAISTESSTPLLRGRIERQCRYRQREGECTSKSHSHLRFRRSATAMPSTFRTKPSNFDDNTLSVRASGQHTAHRFGTGDQKIRRLEAYLIAEIPW